MKPPVTLPLWMTYFSFWVSVALSILAIAEIFSRFFRKSSLELIITKEIFSRILNYGEAIYTNCVLVAHDAGALITAVKGSIQKTNTPNKEFILSLSQVGEKYRAEDGAGKYYFHSPSPLVYIPENCPLRILYVCTYTPYSSVISIAFLEYSNKIYSLKEEYRATDMSNEQLLLQLRSDIEEIIQTTTGSIMDNIQIEEGEYTLKLDVDYKQKGKWFPLTRNKKVSSQIKFSVKTNVKETLRHLLRGHLESYASNILFNSASLAPFPEYAPIDVLEIT